MLAATRSEGTRHNRLLYVTCYLRHTHAPISSPRITMRGAYLECIHHKTARTIDGRIPDRVPLNFHSNLSHLENVCHLRAMRTSRASVAGWLQLVAWSYSLGRAPPLHRSFTCTTAMGSDLGARGTDLNVSDSPWACRKYHVYKES